MARETQGSPSGEKKLERYGVWVKVKPKEVTEEPEAEESFELSDLDSVKSVAVKAPPAPESGGLTAEEEQLLDELETELGPDEESTDVLVPEEEPLIAEEIELPDIEGVTSAPASSEVALGQPTDEELPELELELEEARPSAEQAAAAEVEVTLSESPEKEDQFDDLEALETELAAVTTKPRDAGSSSAEILSRIEEELRSIRTDLTQLRTELSTLRSKGAGAAEEAPSEGSENKSGFFDEDEDETIALTGDELDNILNTADITEEAAEVPGVELDDVTQPADESVLPASPEVDILSYETPVLEEDKLPIVEEDFSGNGKEEISDSVEEVSLEELPSELVLDELAVEPAAEKGPETESFEGLPELEIESVPETESIPSTSEESETIDLETLDLGEEPTIIEAQPQEVTDLEAIPEAESLEEESATETAESTDLLSDEVDLEALAAEAEELESGEPPAAPVDDLEIGELESVAEEGGSTGAPENEIEIEFEGEQPAAEQKIEDLEPIDLEGIDEALDAAEAPEEKPAAASVPAGNGGEIPDNLKDEIRTVLKYMDHLLEALPDEKIKEFASSDYFVMYKKLFEDLGLGE